jgi:uncharacterized small protein (DUF1192 family)
MALAPAETVRLAQLKAKKAGRSQSDGNPRKGYSKNVVALTAEIVKLEAKAKTVDTAPKPA